jgi:hypothetical protein
VNNLIELSVEDVGTDIVILSFPPLNKDGPNFESTFSAAILLSPHLKPSCNAILEIE